MPSASVIRERSLRRHYGSDDSRSPSSGSDSDSSRSPSDSSSSSRGSHEKHSRSRKRRRKGSGGAYYDSLGDGQDQSSGSGKYVGLGIALVLVIALCFGAYWYTDKYGLTMDGFSGSSGSTSPSTDTGGSAGSGGSGSGDTGAGGSSGDTGGGDSGAGDQGSDTSSPVATGSTTDRASATGTHGATGTGSATGTKGTTKTGTGSTSASSSTATPPKGGGSKDKIILGYYPNYSTQKVEDVPFDKYTHMLYFVAVPAGPDKKGELTMGADDEAVKNFVSKSKAAKCSPILVVGGWTGSATFTKLVASDTSRQDFATTMLDAVKKFEFEGLDIDWEYPGRAGASQDFAKDDFDNLVSLFKILREKDSKLHLSVASSMGVYVDSSGSPAKDVSAFYEVLDSLMIMTYDACTATCKESSPNISMDKSCAPTDVGGDIPSAIDAWIGAGFKADKLMVGIPFYGYVFSIPSFSTQGLSNKGGLYQTTSGSAQSPSQYTFKELDSNGFLTGKDGFKSEWDECSSTPYLWSEEKKLLIPYDDKKSIAKKAGYAKEKGLKGCGIFDTNGDKGTELIDAVIAACT